MNSDQHLIIRQIWLFDLLKLKISYPIVAIDNSFHGVGWSGSVAVAVIGRRPVGDEAPEDQRDKNDA
ncbi:MAG: hypothetical protein DMF44_15560 [Verrucomicrobia bacterium]|nr:MAG: hypothetical protein DMF44_15560 [Verrucomicrobiota bacterium]